MNERHKTTGKKEKPESGTRSTAFQMPLTQLRISTCYFVWYFRSHSATQWNKLHSLINCANRAMRMFAVNANRRRKSLGAAKREAHEQSLALTARHRTSQPSDQHLQHVTERRNQVISTYSTSPNVATKWSAHTARHRTSQPNDLHLQHVTERRNRVICTYSTSSNVATEWSALTARHRTSQPSDQHLQHVIERRNQVISTYSTSPKVATKWSALTARQRTSQQSDLHLQHVTESRNQVISTYRTSSNVATE
jgi:hypothetical protein